MMVTLFMYIYKFWSEGNLEPIWILLKDYFDNYYTGSVEFLNNWVGDAKNGGETLREWPEILLFVVIFLGNWAKFSKN